MLVLHGKKVPEHKSIKKGLSLVYGIGNSQAKYICNTLGLNSSAKIQDLSAQNLLEITKFVEDFVKVPSEAQKIKRDAIQSLVDIRCYRGLRHRYSYPVRGQRTKTNGKSQKRLGIKNLKMKN